MDLFRLERVSINQFLSHVSPRARTLEVTASFQQSIATYQYRTPEVTARGGRGTYLSAPSPQRRLWAAISLSRFDDARITAPTDPASA
jgi:hypothetical protein